MRFGRPAFLFFSFQFLGFFPDGVHLGQRHVVQVAAFLDGVCLEVVEAADELLVGVLQGVVGVDLVEAGGIDETEQHVAEFFFGLLLVHVGHFGLKLLDFFLYLVPHLFALFPVETYVAGLVLYAVGLDERGQGSGYA